MSIGNQESDRIKAAFYDSHDGWSSDSVVAMDTIRARVVAACRAASQGRSEFEVLWHIQSLRKASKLGKHTTRRTSFRHEEYAHAAEIASRRIEDTHGVTIDRALCDPSIRAEFDQLASKVAPDVDLDRLRLAAIGLRKRGGLKPELTQLLEERLSVTVTPSQVLEDPECVPDVPGIYVFHGQQGERSPLYIGEASNLRTRLRKHSDHSDNASLARYLWSEGLEAVEIVAIHAVDPAALRSRKVRRAIERNLIESRGPQFNVEFNRGE